MLRQSCRKCGKEADKKCQCGGVFYCGKDCQNLDWKSHKKACKALRSDEGNVAKTTAHNRKILVNSMCNSKYSDQQKTDAVRKFGEFVDQDLLVSGMEKLCFVLHNGN